MKIKSWNEISNRISNVVIKTDYEFSSQYTSFSSWIEFVLDLEFAGVP